MSFNVEEEVKLKVLDHASQVALEFLRARPLVDKTKVIENYNQIFEKTYRHMTEVAGVGK